MELKLLQCNVGSKFYNIINSMYKKSEACVKISYSRTNSFPVKFIGVCQGDNLRTTLFKIFIYDLPSYLQTCFDAVELQYKKLDCLMYMYTDDIVIFSTSANGLQQKLKLLEKYCSDWCMKVNIKKTKVLIFNKAGRTIEHKFFFQNSLIDCISNYKYLGIHFSASGTFSSAKHELCKKALKAYFKLRKDF
jgi:hypothetical protein